MSLAKRGAGTRNSARSRNRRMRVYPPGFANHNLRNPEGRWTFTDSLRHCRRRRAAVARVAEAEDGVEDERQEPEPDAEACALAEALSHGEGDGDQDEEVHERNEQQDDPPGGLPGDLEQDEDVVNRN